MVQSGGRGEAKRRAGMVANDLWVKLDAPARVRGLAGYPERDTQSITALEALMMAEIREAYAVAEPWTPWTGFRMAAGDDTARSAGLPGHPGDLNYDLTPVEVLRARLEQGREPGQCAGCPSTYEGGIER